MLKSSSESEFVGCGQKWMGRDSSHETLKWRQNSKFYVTSFMRHHEKYRMTFGEGRYANIKKLKKWLMINDNF